MALNPTHLASFRAVARSRGFSAASQVTLISQPALSKQVALLEKQLGAELLCRTSRGVTLTGAGERLLEYADRIADLMDEAERCTHDDAHLARGRLRVGATPTIGTYFMPQSLVYFRRRFPGIELHAEVNDIRVLHSRLADNLLDVVLTTSDVAVPGARAVPLFRTPLLAVAAPTCTLPAAAKLKMRDLAAVPLIVRDAASATGDDTRQLLRVYRLTNARLLTFSTTESMKWAAAAGLGVTFVPAMSVERELRDGTLRQLPVSDLKAHQTASWIERGNRERSKPAHAYWCILKHAHRGTLPKPRA